MMTKLRTEYGIKNPKEGCGIKTTNVLNAVNSHNIALSSGGMGKHLRIIFNKP